MHSYFSFIKMRLNIIWKRKSACLFFQDYANPPWSSVFLFVCVCDVMNRKYIQVFLVTSWQNLVCAPAFQLAAIVCCFYYLPTSFYASFCVLCCCYEFYHSVLKMFPFLHLITTTIPMSFISINYETRILFYFNFCFTIGRLLHCKILHWVCL